MFTLALRPGETIKRVRDVLPEVSLALSNMRGRAVDVRLNEKPLFMDVPHADPRPIRWTSDRHFIPHHALAGRGWSFRGGADQWVNLTKEPHVLVAGITGSGKSVLTLNLALSLALGTSPEDMVMVLVDLKNDDLVPLKGLPHVIRFAGDPEGAVDAVEWVYDQVDARRRMAGRPNWRVVLVIDELAQLPGDAKDRLTSITALGRSMWVNVLGATQHPTAEVLGGSVGKINYTARFTGLVADASAASTASGRPKTGAEFLPGNGAFVRTGGPEVTRLQSFLIEEDQVEEVVADVAQKWVGYETPQKAQTASMTEVRIPTSTGVKMAQVDAQAGQWDELADYFTQNYDGQGGLVRGTMAGAIRLALGEDVKRGRGYSGQVAQVQALIQEWLTEDEDAQEEGEREWAMAGAD